MAFTSTLEMDNGIAKLTAAGEIDASVAPEFRARIEEAAGQRPRALVLLLQDLSYMSSAGLRALVFAKQKMGVNTDLFIVGAQDSINETLELTGFQNSVISLPAYDRDAIEGRATGGV